MANVEDLGGFADGAGYAALGAFPKNRQVTDIALPLDQH